MTLKEKERAMSQKALDMGLVKSVFEPLYSEWAGQHSVSQKVKTDVSNKLQMLYSASLGAKSAELVTQMT